MRSARIEVIDALRGFAVFGILVSHCYYLFFLGEATFSTSADENVSLFIRLMVNDKFYSLFSILFGLSFALMLTRSKEISTTFYLRFSWRLVLLGIIGLLHNLHWNDDILSIYAFLGFILLPVSRLNHKIVLLIAFLLLVNIPSYFIEMTQSTLSKDAIALKEMEISKTYEKFAEAMQHGTYFDTVRANISVYTYKLEYYLYSGRFSYMLGFFLLGMLAGIKELFQQMDQSKFLLTKIFYITGTITLIFTISSLYLILHRESLSPEMQSWSKHILKFQSIALTLTYASGMPLFFASAGKWFSKHFAVVGKMALTNYILHSVLGTILLCGYGFGLINNSISVSIAVATSIPLFIFMILFSHLWLRNFFNGPLEWLWRSATNLKLMPLRRKPEHTEPHAIKKIIIRP